MMLYFKCTKCHEESRRIQNMDKRGYTSLGNGRYRFNPDAPKPEEMDHWHICSCGHRLKATEDPQAVRSFIKFDTFDYQ